jgi:DNA-directed RNA polymerase subunit omega
VAVTNPPIGILLGKVDCRYTLVVEVSKRARQLVSGMQPLIDNTKEARPVSVAVDEVQRGLITYDRPTLEEEER